MWKIEHRAYRLPFRRMVRTAHGPWAEREGWLLRAVRIDEAGRELGAVAWGEVAPIPWFGTESVAAAGAALADLRGRAASLADALARVPAACVCTRAGLAAAMERGAGSGEGRDRSEAQGEEGGAQGAEGDAGAVKFLPVTGLLPAGRAALEAVAPALELGFRTFKWKVGVGDAADEWAILDDLLGELPAGAKLRLDANGAWDRRVAERWLERAAERPVEYVEQPCLAAPGASEAEARRVDDVLRGLAADYPVTLALDESITAAHDVERWLALDWRGVWVLKPALLGGPEPVLEKLARARADVVFGSALETAVGARAGLRLAFAWAERVSPERRRALGYGVWPLFADSRADAPWVGPFVRREDLARINAEELWNALS